VSYLRTLRAPEVALLGFSDSSGDTQANLALSQERAKRVADELTSRGVEVASVDGLGDQMPVGSNDTPAGRLRNRRVEVWISGSD
jgi:phosphate transport system substrate-binding protein